MTKNPSRKLSKVFALIILIVIRMHVSKWKVVIICRFRTPRRTRTVTILPQVIRLHFGEWEAVVVLVYSRFGEVGIVMFLLLIPHWKAIPNLKSLRLMGCSSIGPGRSHEARSSRREVKIMPVLLKNIYFLANYRDYNCTT